MRGPRETARRTRRPSRRRESGSALMIATMVAVILTLLGLSYLVLADQENQIAVNQRDSDQLLFVGEAGAKMVKAWFDRPTVGDPNVPSSVLFKFMDTYDMRNPVLYDFTKRVYDHDNNPNTAEVLASSGDPNRPLFRQGMLVKTGSTFLTMWDKPYRGSNTAEFKGLESGSDVVIESNTTGLDALDLFNFAVVGNVDVQHQVGRIQKIEIYAPPIITINGVKTRYGICTVKVTAAKFKRMGTLGAAKVPVTTASSVEVSRRIVKMVLNEAPYPGPTGPFQSCADFQTNGNVQVHWGEVSAKTVAQAGAGATCAGASETDLFNGSPPSVPFASVNKYISGSVLSRWVTENRLGGPLNAGTGTGTTSSPIWFDPWYRLRAGGDLCGANPNNVVQPYVYPGDANTAPPIESGNPTNNVDETNLIAHSPPQCPDFDYQIWKNVALSGGQDIHFMKYAAACGSTTDTWREDGVGTAADLQTWTSGKTGFWFFDTCDGLTPDPGGANIKAKTSLSGGTWNAAGFIYYNGDWDSSGIGGGANQVVIPPGEPWIDADNDKVVDVGEWVNLKYPTSLSNPNNQFIVVAAGDPNGAQSATVTSTNGVVFTGATDPNARDSAGIPFSASINMYGVLYVSGRFEATGNLVAFGSVIAKGGMHDSGAGPTAGTPLVMFDERLIKGEWPPPDINLPRTTITFWQTEM